MRRRVTVVVLSVCYTARMREDYCNHLVCVCVCYQSSAIVRRLRYKLNLPGRSSLNSEGFQLADFAETLSLPRYSSLSLGDDGHFETLRICNVMSFDDHYQSERLHVQQVKGQSFADRLGLLRFLTNSRCTKDTAMTSFQLE